jgi:3-hydroxyacyl-CoA dehydrogenase/enoyl-CoA hydratase/carnithine racemase
MSYQEVITEFHVTFNNSRVGKVAIITMDNGEPYTKPNTFGYGGIESLNKAIDAIEAEKDVKGVMLVGKPFIFAVGADLDATLEIHKAEDGYKVGKAGHDAMKRIMDLSVPTLAAINGVAMGGGLEISLYCDYRSISDAVPIVALPECFLGLVPGWGGTQLLPKLIGPEKAIQVIITNPLNRNKMLKVKEAVDLGIADFMLPNGEFYDMSFDLLVDIIDGKKKVERPAVDWSNFDQIYDGTKAVIDGMVHGAAIAPYRALDLIKGAKEWDFDKGFEEENKALGELIISDQCRAGVYSFDLVQRRAKKPVGVPELPPAKIQKIGVIGAGLMGAQIASLFLQRYQCPIVMKDIKQEFVDKGVSYVHEQVDKWVKKGRVNEGKALWLKSLVQGTLDYKDFAQCNYIIEAVLEEMPIKKKVFAEVEEHIPAETILATNTSSLSISEMASDLKHPERVVGFHFFNPVAVMPLLEIVKGEKTSDQTLATAFAMGKKIKKTSVLVKDSAAFLVNRLLTRWMGEIMKIIDEGSNPFKEIDEFCVSLGFPMTPFSLLALVGPAVALHVAETLRNAFGDRFYISEGFKKLVELKKPGVYDWEGNEDPDVVGAWPRGDKAFTKEQVLDRFLEALTEECRMILDEGVVADAKDIDTCMIMGAGWPFFMGGVTKYLDQKGYSKKVTGKLLASD